MDYHHPITKNNQIFSTMTVLVGCVVVVVGYIYILEKQMQVLHVKLGHFILRCIFFYCQNNIARDC